ncbi:MAG: VOC family protein [Candidatus Lokiarchaeota archaeon]|nr:VOC family protein [Candidatus Lokiarchaeota archaeon]
MERKINQVGIVVKDAARAAEFYQRALGVPFQVMDRPKETCQLHGKESCFQMRTAFGNAAGLQVELIQVLEGRTAHVEFMESHGEGIHHFGIYVEDIEAEIEACAKQGIGVISRGEFLGVKWAYVDSVASAGAVFEFIEMPKPRARRAKTEPATSPKHD